MRISSRIKQFLPGTEFVIEIDDGNLHQYSKRRIPKNFISDLKYEIAQTDIKKGAIYGVWHVSNLERLPQQISDMV